MKNKLLSLLSAMTIITGSIFAQFEGKIEYKLDYKLPEAMEAQRSMLPSEMLMCISKNKTKVTQQTMMGSQTVITNTETNSSTLLMDMMGQKMAIELPKQDEEEPETTYKYTNKFKKIAGYKCNHATMMVKESTGEEIEVDIYYTKEIPSSANDKLKGLKGFPLEYTIISQGLTMIVSAESVAKTKIEQSEFKVPADYEKLTMEQFKEKMGMGQ